MLDEIVGTLLGRWYVTIFGSAFLLNAVPRLGWRRTAAFSGFGVTVAILAETGSVSIGFPYTRYAFNESLRGDELFVGDVPLMVPLSYTFVCYFAFGAARVVVGGPHRLRSELPVLEYVTAVMLAVWSLWVIDPVSRLGRHYFLGELFQYEGPGFWFGLPLGSQLGFTLTAGILVAALAWLARDEEPEPVPRLRDHPYVGAFGGYVGQLAFMAGTAFYVARTNSDPAVTRAADALAGSPLIVGLPAALLVAVYWRSLAAAGDHSERTRGERHA